MTDLALDALRLIRHDFKTPLTSLKMLAQIFKLGLERGTLTSQPERTERNVAIMISQIDKLVQLADSLYEISVIQSGRLELDEQTADLRPVIQQAIEKPRDKVADLELPSEPIWGKWDTAKLAHALEYIFAEVEAPEIRLSERQGQALIAVSGGLRIQPDKVSPGLFIARALIEKHGGNLKISPEEKRLLIELPMVQAAAAASPERSAS